MSLAMLCSTLSQAQNSASTDTTTVKKQPSEVTEEVDGLFAFAGYLGKKIYNEVSDQFDEGEPGEKAEIKRVRIKLGPIKIERIEKR